VARIGRGRTIRKVFLMAFPDQGKEVLRQRRKGLNQDAKVSR
jgi:hypothetical protein